MSGGSGLYLHVPFCTAVCPYCDFAVVLAGEARRREYGERLAAEAILYGGWPHPLDTVYLGGGTPSALDPELLASAVAAVRAALPVTPGAWLTLEANPEDVTAETASAWRRLGVRTVSLGVQSLDPRGLELLGRRHDVACARRAVGLLLAAGFDAVSIDLIYGWAGHTADGWRRELAAAASLGPHHLSCYQLTVHEGTRFGRRAARGETLTVDEDGQGELFLLTHRELERLGFHGYEVSNFAREPRYRSRHNLRYWDHTPYLGLGPSAHSFDGRRRWWNRRKLRLWAADLAGGRLPVEGEELLDDRELALEAVLLALRTREGLDLELLRRRYRVDLLAANRERLEGWAREGLVELVGGRVAPTLRGLAVAEALARELEIPTPAVGGP